MPQSEYISGYVYIDLLIWAGYHIGTGLLYIYIYIYQLLARLGL